MDILLEGFGRLKSFQVQHVPGGSSHCLINNTGDTKLTIRFPGLFSFGVIRREHTEELGIYLQEGLITDTHDANADRLVIPIHADDVHHIEAAGVAEIMGGNELSNDISGGIH